MSVVSGFDSWKDILQVLVIPVGIAAIGGIWTLLKLRHNRNSSLRIVRRELQEIAPYPERRVDGNTWTDHQKKQFVHQKWFEDPSKNMDIILRLPEDLVYSINQLWNSKKEGDAKQWLYYLGKLSDLKYDGSKEIDEAWKKWQYLIDEYEKH